MIRRGKKDGWLRAEHVSLLPWAKFNGVTLSGVGIRPVDNKGLAIFASAPQAVLESKPLMHIPQELILSKESVNLHAKSDVHLRNVLEALGDFGRTARGRILVFLLTQATRLCPDIDTKIGVESPLAEYIKFLPMELLPTFWSDEEHKLLIGTSLAPAMVAKMASLYREFELFRSSTADILWCHNTWWAEVDGILTFDDWKQVDAFYRSRALELPGVGDCMVPCVDMCNHASGDRTSALYESDGQGNALLILRDQTVVQEEREITITYGDEKGACEMIFSYGFLEDDMENAKDLFLGLNIPDDDPLRRAKQVASTSAPGVRLIDRSTGLRWESDYVWLVCVNEEDGLEIKVAQLVDGSQELETTWKKENIKDTSRLKQLLQQDPLWNLYQLRAVALLQSRVEEQLEALYGSESLVQELAARSSLRERPKSLALRLRNLEADLLERFYEYFEAEKLKLAQTEEVTAYLARSMGSDDREPDDDFS